MIPAIRDAIQRVNETAVKDLDEELTLLLKYGKPNLNYIDDGWHCSITMWVASEGTEFRVRSDFNHKTAREAFDCCRRRMVDTLRKYGVMV